MSEKTTEEKKGFEWFLSRIQSFFETVFRWIIRYPLAVVGTVLVAALFFLTLFVGMNDRFNWGGIIGWLFGREKKDELKKANRVPEDRSVDKGETGKEGYEQKEVGKIEQSGNPFRDKSVVTVRHPDGKTEKVQLPEGVYDTDVKTIYQLKPEVYEVELKDKPENKTNIDNLIRSLEDDSSSSEGESSELMNPFDSSRGS